MQEGKKYFIRTVNNYFVGRVVDQYSVEGVPFIVLEDASWIADTGRFHDALKDGFYAQSRAEIEPYPNPVAINVNCICDSTIWDHELPDRQK